MINNRTAHNFLVGNVRIEPLFRNITEIQADAFVQCGSAVEDPSDIQTTRWVWESDKDGSIYNGLKKLSPFRLGEVIIVPAGNLPAKYLFNAIVIDRTKQHIATELLNEQVVSDVARKCISVAVALGLKSIAFTPWGTRTLADPSRITAIMLQAITQNLEESSGNLEVVYLISNIEEHYKWFIDRSFVLLMFKDQIKQVKKVISDLEIPTDQKLYVERILNNITHNITVSQFVQGDAVQGDKNQVDNITDSNVALGRDASVDSEVSRDHQGLW
jgi:O-acetyl-ADP-ribose deacetylase (regulator of RNase III)